MVFLRAVRRVLAPVGSATRHPKICQQMTAEQIARIAAKASAGMTANVFLSKAVQIAEANTGLSATLPDTLATSIASKTLAGTLPESAFVGPKLTPGLKQTVFKSLEGTAADPAWKGTLAAMVAGTPPALPRLPGVVSSERSGAQLPVPTRRRRQIGVHPVTPSRSPEVRPRILPQEVGEFLATGLVRADREEVIFLLADTGLDDARQHLEAIEERLLTGTGPSFLHAALSASILLRDLANHLFPPRDEDWESRSGSKHSVRAQNVGNRLSAFVDLRLRSQLSPREHRLFQATLDVVHQWTGEGHHVPSSPREAATSFVSCLRSWQRLPALTSPETTELFALAYLRTQVEHK